MVAARGSELLGAQHEDSSKGVLAPAVTAEAIFWGRSVLKENQKLTLPKLYGMAKQVLIHRMPFPTCMLSAISIARPAHSSGAVVPSIGHTQKHLEQK